MEQISQLVCNPKTMQLVVDDTVRNTEWDVRRESTWVVSKIPTGEKEEYNYFLVELNATLLSLSVVFLILPMQKSPAWLCLRQLEIFESSPQETPLVLLMSVMGLIGLKHCKNMKAMKSTHKVWELLKHTLVLLMKMKMTWYTVRRRWCFRFYFRRCTRWLFSRCIECW